MKLKIFLISISLLLGSLLVGAEEIRDLNVEYEIIENEVLVDIHFILITKTSIPLAYPLISDAREFFLQINEKQESFTVRERNLIFKVENGSSEIGLNYLTKSPLEKLEYINEVRNWKNNIIYLLTKDKISTSK